MKSKGLFCDFKVNKKISRAAFLRITSLTAAAGFVAACTRKIDHVINRFLIQETLLNKELIGMNGTELENKNLSSVLALSLLVDGTYGVIVSTNQKKVWECLFPLELEYFYGGKRQTINTGYTSAKKIDSWLECEGTIMVGEGSVRVTDKWYIKDDIFLLERVCRVLSPDVGGFLTRVRFNQVQQAKGDIRPFVPGMIYGGPENLTVSAIGGALTWRKGRDFTVLIREDRIPNPMASLFVPEGIHLTMFDADPTGTAPMRDTRDTEGEDMLVDGMGLNALGYQQKGNVFSMLFCAPANEGEVTYEGTTYPGGQKNAWRRRYQKLRLGGEVSFKLGICISKEIGFPEYASNTWRSVFDFYSPQALHHDISQVTDSLILTLVNQVRDIPGGGRGIPNFMDSITKVPPYPRHNNAILGFTGKNLESANFMLRWAEDHPDADGERVRREGEAIINKFTELKVNPPEAEGFSMITGAPELAIAAEERVYLRSFGDDMKSLACAYKREQTAGRTHQHWLNWMESFASWLLSQQRGDGSFPRA